MARKKVVAALGHRALGVTLPEQKDATRKTAGSIADLVEAGADVVISHSNAPQVGMIHMAMNEFGKVHPDYTYAPMSVCSAMSQGYRLRPAERDPRGTAEPGDLPAGMYGADAGVRGSL